MSRTRKVFLSDRAAPFGLPSGVACLIQFFQFSFDFGCGVSDVLHRFGQPLLRYIELVSPVLHFMRLKKADSASVLWTRVGEIVRHAFSSDLEVNAVASWQVPGIVRICAPWPAARGKASCTSKQLLRAGCPTSSLSADVGMHVRSAAVVRRLKVVHAPAVGIVLDAPPVLIASEHSVDYTFGRCGTSCFAAQIAGRTIQWTLKPRCVSANRVPAWLIGRSAGTDEYSDGPTAA
jgi:hypothetical protein